MNTRTFAAPWIERKVMKAAYEHLHRYPTFKIDRVLDRIAAMDSKSQAWAAYQPMERFTAQQHKKLCKFEKKERAKRNDSDLQMMRDREAA